ncbi:MAG: GCN5-related N-acetyltransferase [Chthonomonadaceae bacterium]|nr:GCN5-related N-acetyltransferase [Chthonomonadaceae bacterium]
MDIRKAELADWDAIWEIWHAVVAEGATYVYAPDTGKEEAFALWMTPPAVPYVAVEDGQIVGTYLIKPNQPGLGSHVANAGFMVSGAHSGKGIGRTMGQHALEEARRAGFQAMQFNFVVSTNTRAVALWQSLGFAIIGTVPQAYHHCTLGFVDVVVMHRFL